MKLKKALLDSVDADSAMGQAVCCAVYLNSKIKTVGIGGTIHEQVALQILKGNDTGIVARKTGFEKAIVLGALKDIAAFCGASE